MKTKNIKKKTGKSAGFYQGIKYVSATVLLGLLVSGFSACDFVEVDPPQTQLSSALVFADDQAASAAMVGIYSSLMGVSSSFVNHQIAYITGMSCDELVSYSVATSDIDFYNNSLTAENPILAVLWRNAYNYIYQANALIDGIEGSSSLSVSQRNQLLGEAKFIRAYVHFYLVNLFGDIPYITQTDYRVNNRILRVPAGEVYQSLLRDLTEAATLMSEGYMSSDRSRPNRSTATAFLARVYLYRGEWAKAEIESSKLIGNQSVYQLNTELNNVFIKTSRETIWQLAPVITGVNTNEGQQFILTGVPAATALSERFVGSFENGDNRKIKWINSISVNAGTYYFPYKYKVKAAGTVTEFLVQFRLAEQYLIRAEARANQQNTEGALSDLNVIRNRAGLGASRVADQSSLLTAIEAERNAELFTEQGHRWLDLKRTNRAGVVLGALKPVGLDVTDLLYPIPTVQIQNSPDFSQNPGY